ncbi:hypothetical protein H4W34_006715 [Actinomadura algeriensis]|uniref:DinB family protein n=2 Tax=Actinomadura algeriensis TaxID=1679523 RepID=A0ABR9K236_9ACTN|nr:hypothetical protein [Actinomadura algeriensis]MBE1536882.1 hypothetical protein [Actinomadura algeriensis]
MIRNLTAAEPGPDPEPDSLMDSAQPEPFRGALPTIERLTAFRDTVAERVHARMGDIAGGRVAAPAQPTVVATHLLMALTNHEHQHDQWIGEVRAHDLGRPLPPTPAPTRSPVWTDTWCSTPSPERPSQVARPGDAGLRADRLVSACPRTRRRRPAEPHHRARALSIVVWPTTIGSVIGPDRSTCPLASPPLRDGIVPATPIPMSGNDNRCRYR